MLALRLILVVGFVAFGGFAERALACSCVPPGDPREELARADGAFYGELLERRATGPGFSSAEPVVLRYRVIRVFKGDIGPEVEVETAASGASCGIEAEVGDGNGLLLHRDERGRWMGSLCQMRSEEHLAAGLEPLPEPDGRRPARFLAGGGFGAPRMAALDSRGRLIAYGKGPGEVRAIDVCPGAAAAVELVSDLEGRVGVTTRDVGSLRQRETVLLRLRGVDQRERIIEDATGLVCRARDGSRASVFVTDFSGAARIVAIDRDQQRSVWRGEGERALFNGRWAFVARGDAPAIAVDLERGSKRVLPGVPSGAMPLVVSSDGRTLAVTANDTVVLVDTRSGRRVAIGQRRGFRHLARVRSRHSGATAVARGSLYLVRGRSLVRHDSRGTRRTVTRRLFSAGISVLAVVPRPRARASMSSCRLAWASLGPPSLSRAA